MITDIQMYGFSLQSLKYFMIGLLKSQTFPAASGLYQILSPQFALHQLKYLIIIIADIDSRSHLSKHVVKMTLRWGACPRSDLVGH